MNTFFAERRVLRCVLAFAVLASAINVSALAGDDDEYVSNVRVDKQGRLNVFIEYDLEGALDDVFTVTLTVRVASDTSYLYTPVNVIGDIGANIRPGQNKRISWRISDEYLPIFDQEDIEYIVRAIPPPRTGGPELYIAGGVAVVGLALAIVLLSSNKTEEQTGNTFPLPPGRP